MRLEPNSSRGTATDEKRVVWRIAGCGHRATQRKNQNENSVKSLSEHIPIRGNVQVQFQKDFQKFDLLTKSNKILKDFLKESFSHVLRSKKNGKKFEKEKQICQFSVHRYEN